MKKSVLVTYSYVCGLHPRYKNTFVLEIDTTSSKEMAETILASARADAMKLLVNPAYGMIAIENVIGV